MAFYGTISIPLFPGLEDVTSTCTVLAEDDHKFYQSRAELDMVRDGAHAQNKDVVSGVYIRTLRSLGLIPKVVDILTKVTV